MHAHRGRKIPLLSAPCSVGQRHHHRDLSSHCFDSGEAQGNEGGSPESLEEGVFFGGGWLIAGNFTSPFFGLF